MKGRLHMNHHGLMNLSFLTPLLKRLDAFFRMSSIYSSCRALEYFETQPLIEGSLEAISTASCHLSQTPDEHHKVRLKHAPNFVPKAHHANLRSED